MKLKIFFRAADFLGCSIFFYGSAEKAPTMTKPEEKGRRELPARIKENEKKI